ncbi:hypothetical protein [Alkaliphilus hydrothermalis]|uniref:Uncharacterized protein n=1 Tax=Alkaliphilus hydrothermalis TaxID=1482730 RepID=A0ABS2NPX4_9FIRM|nr:hypothetical protein [Alkaliphilus hydrothermalis]MBM7614986.1 hypothetical protein [Alkaliphilus hydrothermalis]
MGEFEERLSKGEGNVEIATELIDSLSEWALREGYSQPPKDLAELFIDHKQDKA